MVLLQFFRLSLCTKTPATKDESNNLVKLTIGSHKPQVFSLTQVSLSRRKNDAMISLEFELMRRIEGSDKAGATQGKPEIAGIRII